MKNETQKHFGKLIFSESRKEIENIWLEIHGDKISVRIPKGQDIKEVGGVIWGEFNSLGIVSLLDCWMGKFNSGFGGNEIEIIVHKLIQGVKLLSNHENFITNVTLSCPTLNHWLNSGKSIKIEGPQVIIPTKEKIEYIETEGFVIEIISHYPKSYSATNLSIQRQVSLLVSFKTSLNIFDYYMWKKKLEKLIVYLTNQDPTIKTEDFNNTTSKIYGINSKWQAQQFYHSIDFDFSEIKINFPEIIKSWFDKPKLDSVINLISEKKLNTQLSNARYFLNMCVAIESFHEDFICKKPPLIDDSILENIDKINQFLKVDEELSKWFKEKSKFWKKPTLIDRLFYFKDELQAITTGVFKISTDDLLRKMKSTRDSLAHKGKSNAHFKNEISLFIAAYSLEILLKYNMLKILGMNNPEALKSYLNNATEIISHYADINSYKGMEP